MPYRLAFRLRPIPAVALQNPYADTVPVVESLRAGSLFAPLSESFTVCTLVVPLHFEGCELYIRGEQIFEVQDGVKTRTRTAKTTDYHHGDLRAALIDAGRSALDKISPQDLSLRYLARIVGVSEAAPSRHFAGIEALLACIAAGGFRELAALRINIRDSSDTTMSKAFRMMHAYVDFARRQKGLFGLMIGPRIVARDAYPELIEESGKSFRLFAEAMEALAIEYGWEAWNFDLITHAAWSMEHGVATLIVTDRIPRSDMPIETEPLVNFAIVLILSAITAGPKHLRDVLNRVPPVQTVRE